jgi:DMSO reductase anchor subunit
VLGPDAVATRILGLIAASLGLVTVGCTAMIYASLKPIRQWHNPHTAPDYLIFAVFSGAVLLAALWSLWFGAAAALAVAALVAALVAAGAKFAYWRYIDTQKPLVTLASATGLTAFGTARPLDGPHFTENYILREMGYQIARKHAVKLRRIAVGLAFFVPASLALLAAFGVAPAIVTTAAALVALIGMFVERWLFFAEATHVSTIYYGR